MPVIFLKFWVELDWFSFLGAEFNWFSFLGADFNIFWSQIWKVVNGTPNYLINCTFLDTYDYAASARALKTSKGFYIILSATENVCTPKLSKSIFSSVSCLSVFQFIYTLIEISLQNLEWDSIVTHDFAYWVLANLFGLPVPFSNFGTIYVVFFCNCLLLLPSKPKMPNNGWEISPRTDIASNI